MEATYHTVVDHKKRTITTYEITDSVIEAIKNLAEVLPKKGDKEPEYSLGFQRYEKLGNARKKRIELKLMIAGCEKPFSYLRDKLQNMTEEEFIKYKNSN